ncbi:hypothetical protein [Anaerotignum sp.]|uniref:hypothetical protein n=1 Tax=Anaerotignum sp. TaxID=2039241 RepID=UPI0028AC6E5B|nr:hypothetical protein [Anaerotignum sp.]
MNHRVVLEVVVVARTAKKKEYTVKVHYCEKTPEEAERLRKEQAELLMEMKLRAMVLRGEPLPPGLEPKWD